MKDVVAEAERFTHCANGVAVSASRRKGTYSIEATVCVRRPGGMREYPVLDVSQAMTPEAAVSAREDMVSRWRDEPREQVREVLVDVLEGTDWEWP